MKNEIRLALLFLAAASVPAFAQNTTDSRCGTTNYDSSRNLYTITNPTLGTATQQCFITVVSKQSWNGGVPDLSSSQLVEGNYEMTLSGGGGGGGAGGSSGETEHGRTEAGLGGGGGYSAVPVTKVRYLNPGVYRLTIGTGGQGGTAGSGGQHEASSGGRGTNGAPTSLSNAYTGETVAGFTRAEFWDGNYPQNAQADNSGDKGLMAFTDSATPARSGEHGTDGGTGTGSKGVGDRGAQGGNGFIKLALKDPVPQAAPVQAAPVRAAPVQAVPDTSSSSETVTAPAPAAARPARRDRN